MNNLELSIVIPAFCAAETIQRTIASLEKQTVGSDRYEIIIVDDGSPDDTYALCMEEAAHFSNLTVVRKENGGVSSARNVGLSLVRGKWVTFVDSDDFVASNYVETVLTEGAEEDYVIFNHCEGELGKIAREKNWMQPLTGQVYPLSDLMRWMCDNRLNSLWDKRFSAEIIQEQGIRFEEGIHAGEDLLFNFAYVQYISQVYISEKSVYVYTDNLDGLCRKRVTPSRLKEFEYVYSVMCQGCQERQMDPGYQRILRLSFLRIIARYAGQLHTAGLSNAEIHRLFAASDMVRAVQAEKSGGMKDGVRKLLLKARLYGICAVVISAK